MSPNDKPDASTSGAPPAPALLYLHGFASSPGSVKARAFAAWAAAREASIDVLDLRVPSFEHLRFSAMKNSVRTAIDAAGGARARAVLIGSSLGGLTACRVAEEDPRVAAVFLMAPAFRLAERWRMRLGEAGWEAWRRDGALEIDDLATKRRSRVDFGFVDELGRLDAEGGGFPDVRVPTCIVHGRQDDDRRHRALAFVGARPPLRAPRRGRRRARARLVDSAHPLGSRSVSPPFPRRRDGARGGARSE